MLRRTKLSHAQILFLPAVPWFSMLLTVDASVGLAWSKYRHIVSMTILLMEKRT
jgi:hypothetical protein